MFLNYIKIINGLFIVEVSNFIQILTRNEYLKKKQVYMVNGLV